MGRHVVRAAALAGMLGLGGLSGCAGTSQDLTGTPTATDTAASSAGAVEGTATGQASGTGQAPGTGQVTSRTPAPSAGGPTTGAAPAAATVPEAYRGRWNLRPADCGRDASEGSLTVEAHRMTFYESVGRVVAVTPGDDRISVTLALSGEGTTRTDTRTWVLSPDGATLTDVTHRAVRSRCR